MTLFDLRVICPSSELISGSSELIFSGGGISIDTSTTEKSIMDANDRSDAGEYYA